LNLKSQNRIFFIESHGNILAGEGGKILRESGEFVEVLTDGGVRMNVPVSKVEREEFSLPVITTNPPAMGDLSDSNVLVNARAARLAMVAVNPAAIQKEVDNALARIASAKEALSRANAELREAVAAEIKIISAAKRLCRVKALSDDAIIVQLRGDFPRYAKK
jgi:hypothetical protein